MNLSASLTVFLFGFFIGTDSLNLFFGSSLSSLFFFFVHCFCVSDVRVLDEAGSFETFLLNPAFAEKKKMFFFMALSIIIAFFLTFFVEDVRVLHKQGLLKSLHDFFGNFS